MTDQHRYGYFGKILEIDLCSQNATPLLLDKKIFEDYIGGRGMATRLFFDRVDPACDPLGPENILVLATSAIIGTRAPTGCRGHMVFKSPLTGMIGSSNCGGTWAPIFKSTGYDALVIKGKAAAPVIIDIRPDRVEFTSAEDIWGMDVPSTTEKLLSDSPADHRPRILCIGPAGENLVRFASVMNDNNRAYGRSGPGAVFGSKNLKAIRVSGREKIQIKDPERFQSGLDQTNYLLKSAPITKRLLRELGTSGLIKLIDIIDMLPHKNFQDTLHREEDLDKVSGETLSKTLLKKAGSCYGCPMACQRHTEVGGKSGEGPEYETDVMMGPNCGIYDLEAITRANYLCNELGIDTISLGGTLACAIELIEKGIIPSQEADVRNMRFGNPGILEKAVQDIAYRRGFGDRLAEGSYRLAEHYKHTEYSMTVKKLEIPGYDPRASYTQALGYMTSPIGACHLRGGYAVSLAFFGGAKEIPRFSLHQSPLAIRNMQNLGILQDSLGICRFTGFAFAIDPWSRMISGITGFDFSTSILEKIANRIATLERLFNLKAGLTPEQDDLPERFCNEPIQVAGEDKVISKDAMERMKQDYYSVRQWDPDGRPSKELLNTLRIN